MRRPAGGTARRGRPTPCPRPSRARPRRAPSPTAGRLCDRRRAWCAARSRARARRPSRSCRPSHRGARASGSSLSSRGSRASSCRWACTPAAPRAPSWLARSAPWPRPGPSRPGPLRATGRRLPRSVPPPIPPTRPRRAPPGTASARGSSSSPHLQEAEDYGIALEEDSLAPFQGERGRARGPVHSPAARVFTGRSLLRETLCEQ